jgi:hypothetical protein
MTTLVEERRLLGPQNLERSLHLGPSIPPLRSNYMSRKTPMSQQFEGNERAEIPKLLNTNLWNVYATARGLGIGCDALCVRMPLLGLYGPARRRH